MTVTNGKDVKKTKTNKKKTRLMTYCTYEAAKYNTKKEIHTHL